MVYLLGQMGDNKRALNLIISRLGDVRRAIEFAQQQNDPDLWEDLINYSMDKPKFIVGLLENVGSYIDPIKLIRRIPKKMEIPGLKDTLIKVMQDYGVQMSLREGCEKILVSDTIELFEQLYNAQKRGMIFEETIECSICNNEIINDITDSPDSTVIVFFCRHWFHERCLQSSQNIAYLMNSKAIKLENSKEISKKVVLAKAIEAIYFPVKLNLNSSSLNQFGHEPINNPNMPLIFNKQRNKIFNTTPDEALSTENSNTILSSTPQTNNNDNEASHISGNDSVTGSHRSRRRPVRVIQPKFKDLQETNSTIDGLTDIHGNDLEVDSTTMEMNDKEILHQHFTSMNQRIYGKKGLYCPICQSSSFHNLITTSTSPNPTTTSTLPSGLTVSTTGKKFSNENSQSLATSANATTAALASMTPFNSNHPHPILSAGVNSGRNFGGGNGNNNGLSEEEIKASSAFIFNHQNLGNIKQFSQSQLRTHDTSSMSSESTTTKRKLKKGNTLWM